MTSMTVSPASGSALTIASQPNRTDVPGSRNRLSSSFASVSAWLWATTSRLVFCPSS